MAKDCGCSDDYAALATKTDVELDVPGPDPRGSKVTKWGPNLIAPYGKPTGDKRRFRSGSLTNRELPMPLKWQREDNAGHATAVTVGTLDGIEYTDEGVMGWGILLDPDPAVLPRLAEDVAEARLLLDKRVIGPSVDIDDMEYQPFGDPGELSADTRPEVEVTKGRISAATLVQIPAFAEARPFTLTEMDAEEYAEMTSVTASGVMDLSALPVAAGVEWDVLGWLASDLSGALYEGPEGVLFPVAAEVDGTLSLVPAAVADAVSVMAFQADQVQLGEGVKTALRERLDELTAVCELPATPWSVGALTASVGGRSTLPAAAFENPKLTGPTPMTWEELPGGFTRVYGHLATWSTCHIGFPGTCVTPPRSRTEYKYFHVGEVETDAGPLAVGKITLGGGHADTHLGFQAALAHYDDSGAAVADVLVGEDKFGIWYSGVVRRGIPQDRLDEFSVSPLSGDWRRIGGQLEMVAALAVNTPGFPVPRVRQANGRQLAMVAAGAVYDPSDERVKANLGKKKKRRRDPDEHDYEYADGWGTKDVAGEFASLTREARDRAAEEGKANPDGSYPIRNVRELEKAIQAFGRSKNKVATKRLIMRRARELNREDLIPDGWRDDDHDYALAVRDMVTRERTAATLAVTIEESFGALDRLTAGQLAELF